MEIIYTELPSSSNSLPENDTGVDQTDNTLYHIINEPVIHINNLYFN
jgi:hypothetical protein